MRYSINMLIMVVLMVLTSCDVHEFPEVPKSERFHVRLKYETEMTKWEHEFDGSNLKEIGLGETYDNVNKYGKMRYIVRAYPKVDAARATRSYLEEFQIFRDVREGYDMEETFELPGGNYSIMVWSDLTQSGVQENFYDATTFSEIMLQGEHIGATDYRDAFRGTHDLNMLSDVVYNLPDTLDITMQRPLAKYEFVATDLQEFIDKEFKAQHEAEMRGDAPIVRVESDYKVMIFYSGYMPSAYNMHSDKPVDSKLGVAFESKIKVLGENEASLGFDYVFVNGSQSSVVVQVGIFNKEGKQIALSNTINVPLRRSRHTVLKGSFLMNQASGGIVIESGFEGNINITI